MTREIVKSASEEQLAILDASYPVNDEGPRGPRMPRIGMLSKDLTEEAGTGKKKTIKVVQPAGTFFIERESDEEEQDGEGNAKKAWKREYIEDAPTIDVVVFFNRKQLRFFDSADNKFVNSPIFDDMDEVLPLYKGASQIAEGSVEELQSKFPGTTLKGKPTSKLKVEKILYVLYDGEFYQMNLTQSSKFSFSGYERTIDKASKYVTEIGSKEQTNGSNTYQVMTFKKKKVIDAEQADLIIPKIQEMNEFIRARRERNESAARNRAADAELKALGEGSKKSKEF